MNLDAVRTLLEPLRVAIACKLLRGVVRRARPGGGTLRLQVETLAGDLQDDLEAFQDYGFASVPQDGAEVLVGSLAMARDHSIALRVEDRRYRLKTLSAGEVALYTDEGDSVVLERGRVVKVTTDTFQVNAGGAVLTLDADGLTVSGGSIELDAGGSRLELDAGGNVTLEGSAIALDSA